jgi:regulator of protease activity HflC (stomatin/prohibitin superfamily)
VQVIRVQLQPINPPAKALDAFRDVQAARADKERAQNDAHGYANRVVAQAEGEYERIVRASEAYRQERIANAEGEASRFLALYKEYAQAGQGAARQEPGCRRDPLLAARSAAAGSTRSSPATAAACTAAGATAAN